MSTPNRPAASVQEKPKFGVRLQAGIVTYFNGDPILTYEQGEDVAAKIAEAHGEQGEVERVYVL
jgi:hypothetical protein